MRAIVYERIGGPLRLTDIPEPACPPGGALIAVRATGVCRSDWHAWRGHDPVPLPMVPGHEFAGVVAEVGLGVTGFSAGDRVTVPFVGGCGQCEFCLAGDAQVCPQQTQPGFTHHGSFAETVAINAADFNLVALPEVIDFVTAASLGCRFATAYRALIVHGRPGPGQWVAVHGCGGVGLSAIMIAAALGARVLAIDINPGALQRARDAGAQAVLDTAALADPPAVADAITAITDGGAHVSVDALGSVPTATASVLGLRRRGRHVQVGLLLGPAAYPPLPMDRVIGRELEIFGSHGMPARDYPGLLAMITGGRLDPRSLVTREVGLSEAGDALSGMDSGGLAGMTIIVP